MNTKVEEQELPKQRDLLAGKKYRDSIKKWGEPNNLLRKRVIIVPSIACEARDVDIRTSDTHSKKDSLLLKSDSASVSNSKRSLTGETSGPSAARIENHKAWLAERKKLRSLLGKTGLEQNWLEKKSGKTPLELRVLKRMKRGNTPEIRVRRVLPDIVSKGEEEESSTGVDKGVPTIHQPSPAALAIIQDYLEKKRLRLLDLFAQADKDKNWIVSREEFRKIIRSAGIPLSETDLEDLIMALDKDENDALDFLELSTGRQAYLDERIERQSSPTDTRKPNQKESLTNGFIEDKSISQGSEGQDSRPTSPQRTSPTLKEVPDGTVSPTFVRRGSSPSLLEIPQPTLTEKVEKVSLDEMKVMRIKKQQKKKEREKAKQKKKPIEKQTVAPSTMGGATGAVIDRFRKRTLQEYHDTVKLCDMHGVQLSKPLLGRVLLQPEDKPVAQCLPRIRQPGIFTISTRHHVPSSRPRDSSNTQLADWIF
ncbi:EF-hand calcium-binding domain-containing protein 12-like [Actinia tenebrosa]|uniref:EF-hand calcium-binding domain-containing protein 12-like n=1 Tax=Actinia tenebrosa TaxID=6105 RepID=A0A6P8IBZ4_ACTTE|nr:EF-hand calcium-binding domain-containing protein 12-like [Actinia tenebrosa]